VTLYLLSRHGETTLNLEGRLNGDPTAVAELSPQGEEEARVLGEQILHVPIDLCVHSRFDRTRRTAEIALAGRDVPFRTDPLLDDINVGQLEGCSIDEYHAWKAKHGPSVPFPGGESVEDAGRRYLRGLRRLVEEDAEVVLVVCHEMALRYALNAADGSGSLDGPIHSVENATPYVFDEDAIRRAADRIEQLVGGSTLSA
jgi:broad specificity phosphatase PhoE